MRLGKCMVRLRLRSFKKGGTMSFGGFGHGRSPEKKPAGEVEFFPITSDETTRILNSGVKPKHMTYQCGACGQTTNGRVLCDVTRISDGYTVVWCLCSCKKEEPAILVTLDERITVQHPTAREFHSHENWPPDLAKLYDEGAKAYSVGAHTASTMVCRKLLMSCACHEGASDGKPFVEYVTHITEKVLSFPKAKQAIDAIRTIGNEANHDVQFVSADDAKRAMHIVTYMLNTIYALPSA
jgi:hypothetical protein